MKPQIRNYGGSEMPILTIDGKRQIIKMAIAAVGEKAFLVWLKKHEIPSILHVQEKVRRYKTNFFKEMFELI